MIYLICKIKFKGFMQIENNIFLNKVARWKCSESCAEKLSMQELIPEFHKSIEEFFDGLDFGYANEKCFAMLFELDDKFMFNMKYLGVNFSSEVEKQSVFDDFDIFTYYKEPSDFVIKKLEPDYMDLVELDKFRIYMLKNLNRVEPGLSNLYFNALVEHMNKTLNGNVKNINNKLSLLSDELQKQIEKYESIIKENYGTIAPYISKGVH